MVLGVTVDATVFEVVFLDLFNERQCLRLVTHYLLDRIVVVVR
jgi:hypothetical protein